MTLSSNAVCLLSSPNSSSSKLKVLPLDRTVRLLGQGTFGKVVEAVDTTNHARVAIKIIRAIPKYRDASKIEVRVLQKLKERDPQNKQYVVRRLRLTSSNGYFACLANVYIC